MDTNEAVISGFGVGRAVGFEAMGSPGSARVTWCRQHGSEDPEAPGGRPGHFGPSLSRAAGGSSAFLLAILVRQMLCELRSLSPGGPGFTGVCLAPAGGPGVGAGAPVPPDARRSA